MSDVQGIESPILASCAPEKHTQKSGNILCEVCVASMSAQKWRKKPCGFFASKFNSCTHRPQTMLGLQLLIQYWIICPDVVEKQNTFLACLEVKN